MRRIFIISLEAISSLTDLENWKKENPDFTFVPTMGALHTGHLSLVKAAKKTGVPVLVSVFVNPAQFGEGEDFDAYPRNFKEDTKKLETAGATAVWFPTENEIYPNGERPYVHTLPHVFSELEGAARPTHFLGVAHVLYRFFEILHPKAAFFGQKDYQQTVLVRWLLEQYFPKIELNICPIVREEHGLAMSSRNEYLTAKNRDAAQILSFSLQEGKKMWKRGEKESKKIEEMVKKILNKNACIEKIDYAEMRNPQTLEKSSLKEENNSVIFVLAVQVQGVRLLDNIVLK